MHSTIGYEEIFQCQDQALIAIDANQKIVNGNERSTALPGIPKTIKRKDFSTLFPELAEQARICITNTISIHDHRFTRGRSVFSSTFHPSNAKTRQ